MNTHVYVYIQIEKKKETAFFILQHASGSMLALNEVKAQVLESDFHFMVFFGLPSCNDLSVVQIINYFKASFYVVVMKREINRILIWQKSVCSSSV